MQNLVILTSIYIYIVRMKITMNAKKIDQKKSCDHASWWFDQYSKHTKQVAFFLQTLSFSYMCIYIYTATCHGQDNICSRMISMRRDQCIVMLFSSVVCVCGPYGHKRKIQTGNKYWMKRNACVIVSHASNVILCTLKIVYSCVLRIRVQPYCLSA